MPLGLWSRISWSLFLVTLLMPRGSAGRWGTPLGPVGKRLGCYIGGCWCPRYREDRCTFPSPSGCTVSLPLTVRRGLLDLDVKSRAWHGRGLGLFSPLCRPFRTSASKLKVTPHIFSGRWRRPLTSKRLLLVTSASSPLGFPFFGRVFWPWIKLFLLIR